MLANYYKSYGFHKEAAAVYIRGRKEIGQPELFLKELSDIFITQKQYSKAVIEYLKILELQSDPRETRQISMNISNMYDEAEKPELILEAVEREIKDNPQTSELYIILGDLYIKSEQLAKAFTCYQQGDSLAGINGFYLDKFIALCYDKGEYLMSIEAANYYLAKMKKHNNPVTEEAIFYKAKSLAELGAYPTAFELLEMIENNSNRFRAKAEALFIAGEIYADKIQDREKAREKFNELVKSYGNLSLAVTAKIRLAEFDIQEFKFGQARTRLKTITDTNQKNEQSEKAYFLLAEIEFYNAEYQKASQAYNVLFKKHPRGKYINDCLERMTLITDAKGDSSLNLISKASLYHLSGRVDSAVICLKKATENTGSKVYEYALFALPVYYNDLGNWETAKDAYKHYLTAFSDGVYTDKALLNLAEIYFQKAERPDKANELLNQLISDFPYSPLLEQARTYLNRLNAS